MKKILITLFILSSNVTAVFFVTPSAPAISADSFVLIDYNSNKIIASKNLHKKRSPASLIKLMTSFVVLKRISEGFVKFDDMVTISKKAWKTGGSRSFLKVGSQVKLETLLKGMIIQSGNDASVALAEHIAGTEMTFVALMNKYAKVLGMLNTNFESASGLPRNGQFSTSFDMALLSMAIIREFPKYYKWYGQKYFTHNNIKQPNRNKLLWRDKSVDGLKTGYTEKAGYCLVASANRLGMRLISVIMGSSSITQRESQTKQILDYGFRFFETNKVSLENQSLEVHKGSSSLIDVGIIADKYVTLERGKFSKLIKKLQIKSPLIAPIKRGDEVGTLSLIFENEILYTMPILALENIDSGGFFGNIIDSIYLIFR